MIKSLYPVIASLVIAIGVFDPVLAEQRSAEAHTHGESNLDLAIDGNRISILFRAPAHDIVGFENAPDSDSEKKLVTDAKEILSDPLKLLNFPESADCSVIESEVEFETDHDHSEFHAEYEINCKSIKNLETLSAGMFGTFTGMESIHVQLIGDTGQTAVELTADDNQIDLSGIK